MPDSERPDCHKLKEHNYEAVYGRMFPDKPAPTITTGFLSPEGDVLPILIPPGL